MAAATNRLVISAHLDDAAFSCWHVIDDPGLSKPATVATVFATYPPRGREPSAWDRATGATDPAARMLERRHDDVAALSTAGADAIHLPFLDEQYRDGRAPRRAIIDSLEDLCDGYEEVWIPAAIGAHGDHVLCSQAALAATAGLRRFLYADLPYAVKEGWTSLVGAAQRGTHDDNSLSAQLSAAPSIPPRSVPRLHRLSLPEQERKLAAVRLYRSQLPILVENFGAWFDDPGVAAFELYWELEESSPPGPAWRLLSDRLPTGPAALAEPDGADVGPFLSVLTRTRGDRPHALAEALASLAGQTCPDFEVLLLCHDVSSTAMDGIRAALDRMPQSFATRARVIEVEGGDRGRPLNVGTAAAVGRYVAVLDDDDLVTPDWVEQFRRLATHHPGQIVRARVAFLRRDAGWWRVKYLFVDDFDLVDHLVINETAVCGLAYPRTCFTEMGLEVDESLPVVEDWDLLLRAAPLCGVATTAAVTSFYRDWGEGDDSHGDYSEPVWKANERAVIAKADALPLVMPPGSATALREGRMELTRLQYALQAEATAADQLRADHRAAIDGLQSTHSAEVAAVRTQLHLTHRQLEETVEEFRSSTSWRLTAPLRALIGLRSRLGGAGGETGTGGEPPPAEPPADDVDVDADADADADADGRASYPSSYFEDMYVENPDPWGFATRWYERRKYAITLASLPREHYRRAFEPACSIGVLSEGLASRCVRLVASDSAQTAVDNARKRLSAYPHVEVELMEVPGQWPDGSFDLVVLSEFAYFLDDADLTRLIDRTMASLDDDGHVIAVHYLPAGRILHTADEVHAALRAHPDLVGTTTHREPEFLLDVFVRRDRAP